MRSWIYSNCSVAQNLHKSCKEFVTKGSFSYRSSAFLSKNVQYYNLELGLCIGFGPVRRDFVWQGGPMDQIPPAPLLFGSQSRSQQEFNRAWTRVLQDQRWCGCEWLATFRSPPPISSLMSFHQGMVAKNVEIADWLCHDPRHVQLQSSIFMLGWDGRCFQHLLSARHKNWKSCFFLRCVAWLTGTWIRSVRKQNPLFSTDCPQKVCSFHWHKSAHWFYDALCTLWVQFKRLDCVKVWPLSRMNCPDATVPFLRFVEASNCWRWTIRFQSLDFQYSFMFAGALLPGFLLVYFVLCVRLPWLVALWNNLRPTCTQSMGALLSILDRFIDAI